MHEKKTTLAIVSVNSTEQLPVALSMAARVLRAAKTINNTPRLALFGTGISDASPGSVKNVGLLKQLSEKGWTDPSGLTVKNVDVVVGAQDLAVLRLIDSRLGEVCDVPSCDAALCSVPSSELERKAVEETIDCLLREPPVEYDNVSELPYEWNEHVRNVHSFKWVRDLWNQSLRDLEKAKEKDGPDGVSEAPSPFDVLSLCMCYKLASVAFRTTNMAQTVLKSVVLGVEGAKEAGLMRVFPDGVAPSFVEFIEPYILGDDYPWQVTAKGAAAASIARTVLRRTFDHTSKTVAPVLAKASVAMKFTDDVGPEEERSKNNVVLVQGGPAGDMASLLSGRVPVSAVSSEGKFSVNFEIAPEGEWPGALNDQFREVVSALFRDDLGTDAKTTQILRKRIGAYAAFSSRFLQVPDDGKLDAVERISSLGNVISTYPASFTAHVSRQIVVRENFITVASTLCDVSIQPGTSIGCTFVTFCPTMSKTLASKDFGQVQMDATSSLGNYQSLVNAIGRSLERPSFPLGLLTGVLGGVVKRKDDSEFRIALWRTMDSVDEYVTLLPKEYVELAFADYATGSRDLNPDELTKHRKLPFVAADSVFTLFSSNMIQDSMELAFRIPKHGKLPLLGDEETTLYAAYDKSLRAGARKGHELDLPVPLGKGMTSFLVRESANDMLTGLRVRWAKRHVHGTGQMYVLVSDNSALEKVAF
jgi:hypothetical protein